jgi:arginine-tRNA-protein transferase
METVARWSEPPSLCDYSPDHICQREYVCVSELGAEEYMAYLRAGWRRFGYMLFRNRCSGQNACRSLRVDAVCFRPDRSQRRVRKANQAIVDLRITSPSVTPEKIALFDRFHAERTQKKNWTPHDSDDAAEYVRSFVLNPFPTQEWCYFLDGVFAHDPKFRDRSLGTWNVLSVLERASTLGLPHVYLGYAAERCPSLQYKLRFRPNQLLAPDGNWRDSAT